MNVFFILVLAYILWMKCPKIDNTGLCPRGVVPVPRFLSSLCFIQLSCQNHPSWFLFLAGFLPGVSVLNNLVTSIFPQKIAMELKRPENFTQDPFFQKQEDFFVEIKSAPIFALPKRRDTFKKGSIA